MYSKRNRLYLFACFFNLMYLYNVYTCHFAITTLAGEHRIKIIKHLINNDTIIVNSNWGQSSWNLMISVMSEKTTMMQSFNLQIQRPREQPGLQGFMKCQQDQSQINCLCGLVLLLLMMMIWRAGTRTQKTSSEVLPDVST